MESSSQSLSSGLVEFQDLTNEICNNKDIHSYFTVTGDYIPHRLDKIHLCPVDYTTDFQELNTWEFVSCRKTDNEMYPYEGEVTFPCEKYGFLVMDNANASGYTLKYVNKDGIILGQTNIFSILLEETESAMLGMSFVFLPDELNFPQTVESDSPTIPRVDTPVPVPESLASLDLSEPTPSLFPLNQSQGEPGRHIRSEQLDFLEETVKGMKEQHRELEDRYDTKVLECQQLEFLEETVKGMKEQNQELEDRYDTKVLECQQLEFLEETVEGMKEQNQELEHRYETKVLECQQLAFLEGTVKGMKEQNQELEDRYDTKTLECEQLTESNTELRENQGNCGTHRKGFEIFASAFAQLAHALLVHDERVEQVPEALVNSLLLGTEDLTELGEQLNRLIDAANIQKGENESLVLENRKLKDECKNLQAVVQDYKTQLILTNQEQAQISDKMSQLQQDQDILKTLELPPQNLSAPEISPDKISRSILYPPRSRPRHLPFNNGPYEATQSIIMTEPARGKSDPTFPTVKFLKACSLHEEERVCCPICQKSFDKGETSIYRTKHVNRCMENSDEKRV